MKNQTFGDLLNQRNNNFDFLRFLMATLVILHHSFPLLYGWAALPQEPLARLTHEQMSDGALAVFSFFVISGFLILMSWQKSPGLADFTRKRLLRIYPAYVVVLCLGVLLLGPLSGANLHTYFHDKEVYRYIFGNVFFHKNYRDYLPQAFPHLAFAFHPNGSLWTIRYELMCYVMVAVLGLCGVYKRWSGWLVVGIFALAHVGYFLLNAYNIELPNIGPARGFPNMVPYFLAGMCFYQFRDRIPFSRGLFIAALAGVILSVVLKITAYTLPPLLAYILFYVAFHPGIKLQHFGKHGDFSYGIYVYAWPVQQVLIQHFGKSLNPWTLFLAAFTITLCLAALSWHLVEKPFLKLKARPKKILSEGAAEAVVAAAEKGQEALRG